MTEITQVLAVTVDGPKSHDGDGEKHGEEEGNREGRSSSMWSCLLVLLAVVMFAKDFLGNRIREMIPLLLLLLLLCCILKDS